MKNVKRAFGYLLVALGLVVFIALFVSNGTLNEGQIIAQYWYVVVLGFLMVGSGAILTQL
jgi:hypothetical protein